MTSFDQLHPAIQHHVVNSLGWRDLRPFQDAVIPPILAGQHMIVLAPTAGGKTEAAFLPLAPRMLSEGWTGLSVLYICPIKALLNNLDVRLQRYCTLLGRRSALWHGDVTATARRHVLRDPPDCLLTTPESLELMLVSPNVESRSLFSNLRAVVVDEIHAFAGGDTTGADCGQLAGAYWGESGIPAEWRDGLARPDMVEKALRGLWGGCELIEGSEK